MNDQERRLIIVIINLIAALGATELKAHALPELYAAATAAGISRADLLKAIPPRGDT